MFAAHLSIGQTTPLHIRHEHLSPHPDPCRLLYLSDLHLRPARSTTLSEQILAAARSAAPDLLLLGGDLLDHPAALPALRALVADLHLLAPVFAIAGNHDRHVGLPRVRAAVESAGGLWIHSATAHFTHGTRRIAISGPDAPSPPPADFQVLCAHNPRIWKTARHRGFDLVLAGHLHGCQCVAFEFRHHLFPGALFYPYCCLTHKYRSTRLVVSRGISDLVPLRWRCPREVVLCHV